GEGAVVQAARQPSLNDKNGALELSRAGLDKVSRSRGACQWAAALLLARLLRHNGQLAEARDVLRRPGPPTPDALLQIGLIAACDHQLSQAEEAFLRTLQLDPASHVAALNLFWTQLSLGQTTSARDRLPDLTEKASDENERRLLIQMQTLLKGGGDPGARLGDISDEDENRLIGVLLGLGRLETTVPLL